LAMLGTIICLGALSLHLPTESIVSIRFIAGVMSAVTMVAVSVWLFHIIGYHHGAPILYSGVGAGIVASAEIIAAGGSSGISSFALWTVLALASAILCALAWSKVNHKNSSTIPDGQELADPAIVPAPTLGPWMLVLIYGLAGFGYIVTATYLPLLVKNALQHTNPVHIWAAFGLAATPSCFFWHWLHHKLSSRTTMAINLVVQAVGVVLPVFDPSAPVFLASAILVGGTFVGTVAIAMPAAMRVADKVRFNIMATMTAAYGVGQIVGPLASHALFSHTQSFNQPLIAAGAALVVAALACFG
jgi:Na+/melibiose symporter-like transporter